LRCTRSSWTAGPGVSFRSAPTLLGGRRPHQLVAAQAMGFVVGDLVAGPVQFVGDEPVPEFWGRRRGCRRSCWSGARRPSPGHLPSGPSTCRTPEARTPAPLRSTAQGSPQRSPLGPAGEVLRDLVLREVRGRSARDPVLPLEPAAVPARLQQLSSDCSAVVSASRTPSSMSAWRINRLTDSAEISKSAGTAATLRSPRRATVTMSRLNSADSGRFRTAIPIDFVQPFRRFSYNACLRLGVRV
jgi:hypothetical protein